MKRDFSKPLGDLTGENWKRLTEDALLLARQRETVRTLFACPPRSTCLLCRTGLSGAEGFVHRGVDLLFCPRCGHAQTTALPPPGYPATACPETGFQAIYPRLDREAYASRVERVYRPKLDWFLSRCGEAGLDAGEALDARWLELGCGAGYFLSALHDAGVRDFEGVDCQPELVQVANDALGEGRAILCGDSLAETAAKREADIYAAFFVLEHLEDAWAFLDAMAMKPPGTVLYVAVPVLGLATLLESAWNGFSARQLDGAVHTQLYTEKSMEYAFKHSGFTAVAEWSFGQDATDLARSLRVRLAGKRLASPLARTLDRLDRAADGLQRILDEQGLADSRHVLAVRR